MEIKRKLNDSMPISQQIYTQKILEKFNMENNCYSVSTQDLNEPSKIVEVPIGNLPFLASDIFFEKLKILKY